LQADPNPTQFYKWIKENLDPSHHTNAGFINALMTVLVRYITQVNLTSIGDQKIEYYAQKVCIQPHPFELLVWPVIKYIGFAALTSHGMLVAGL
jgi:hypothetical protein